MSPNANALQYQKYRPLSVKPLEFRLLTLKSRNFVDGMIARRKADTKYSGATIQVYCELHHALRNPSPDYAALSYEWSPKKYPDEIITDVPIIVDGTVVHVRPNLAMLFLHLQETQRDVILWADALCVNQGDDLEKSVQIPQMESIYAEALETIVWLGPGDKNSTHTIKMLDAVGRDLCERKALEAFSEMVRLSNHEDTDLYRKCSARVNQLIEEPLRVQERNALTLMAGFRRLCGLSYWERTWILQEFAISRRIKIRLGTATIDFDPLHACMAFMGIFQLHVRKRVIEVFESGGNSICGEQLPGPWINDFFQPLRSKTQGLFGLRVRYQGLSGNSELGRQPLIQHLARAHVIEGDDERSVCERPMDKIYGLWGLAADKDELMNAGLSVDCSKPPSLIYTEAAAAMISCGHPDVLSYCQFPKSDPDMASWVPDWRMPIRRPCGEYAWDTAFRASGDTHFEPVPGNQDIFTLQIAGVKVDKIESIKNPWEPDLNGTMGPENYHKITQYLNNIKDLCDESALKNSSIYTDPTDRYNAYYRIPIADQETTDKGFRRRATADCLEGYVRVQQDIADPDSRGLNQHISKFSYFNMMEYQHFRRPFISTKGFVGLGPAGLREGDVVCIFSGAKLPYILRKCETKWTLIGEAYVHGIMYGGFMTKALQTEVFVIQ